MSIQFQNVSKIFKNNRGIRDISFTLEPGKITVLVGSNGAGKSTIIKILTGLLQPTNGSVHVNKDAVQYMPDDIQFPDTLKAKEILQYLAVLKGISNDEQQQLLERVGLSDAQQLIVRQYSKGMRQRLNLAQSLMGAGELLILDEPTNGLDPHWIANLKHILLEQKKSGQAILFSTHLLSLAEEIADEVIMIHNGEVILQGDANDMKKQHNCATLEEVWLQRTH
ncbi:MAG: ABC transporter ATP-binding protein [Caryophanon sp.]|nr:ABC transporter ATP-binding protein [Caryophanon sp.]